MESKQTKWLFLHFKGFSTQKKESDHFDGFSCFLIILLLLESIKKIKIVYYTLE